MMKITVINGNARHGSTWHIKELLKGELNKLGECETREFILPKDMPHFCKGCYSCFYNGEHTCPHAEYVSPIVKAMEESDVVVLTSPVYALDVAGQMKALLDHLCFMWFSHRPNPKMFGKAGVVITTTAGAGLNHTSKTLRNSLRFWGVKRIFAYNKAVSAMRWDDVASKKRESIKSDIKSLAGKIHNTVARIDKKQMPFFSRMIFTAVKGMMRKNTWNARDKEHWEAQGWLRGVKPF